MTTLSELRGIAGGVKFHPTDAQIIARLDDEVAALKHDIERATARNTALLRREAEALADLDMLMRTINEYRAAVNEAGHHESVAPCAVCTPLGRTGAEQDAYSRAMNAQANRLDAVLAMIKSRRP